MREFLQKEIGLFNYFERVTTFMQIPLAQLRHRQGKRTKTGAPHFGSTDMLVEGFFSNLQDHFNVNTVPTVIRLTTKLLKTDLSAVEYPFCPLCLGIRDKINNLLEVSSTIRAIEHHGEEAKVDAV